MPGLRRSGQPSGRGGIMFRRQAETRAGQTRAGQTRAGQPRGYALPDVGEAHWLISPHGNFASASQRIPHLRRISWQNFRTGLGSDRQPAGPRLLYSGAYILRNHGFRESPFGWRRFPATWLNRRRDPDVAGIRHIRHNHQMVTCGNSCQQWQVLSVVLRLETHFGAVQVRISGDQCFPLSADTSISTGTLAPALVRGRAAASTAPAPTRREIVHDGGVPGVASIRGRSGLTIRWL